MKRLCLPIFIVLFLVSACSEPAFIDKSNIEYSCLNGKVDCALSQSELSAQILTNHGVIHPESLFDVVFQVNEPSKIVNVQGYLEGITMYMGKVPLLFSFDPSINQYRADGFVGSCSEPQMQWRIVLDVTYIDNDKNTQKIQFVDNFYSVPN